MRSLMNITELSVEELDELIRGGHHRKPQKVRGKLPWEKAGNLVL